MVINTANGSTFDNNSGLFNKAGDYQQVMDFLQQGVDQSTLMVELHQQMLKTMVEIWKNLTQNHINAAFELFQFSIDQSLSMRERLSGITEAQMLRLHEITVVEQGIMLDAAEIMQTQTGVVQEQVTDIWQAASKRRSQ